MNAKNLFGFSLWIHEVCDNAEHKALKARNEQRLAALKATNSLTENERTRSYRATPARLDPYYDTRNCTDAELAAIGINQSNLVNSGRASYEQWRENAGLWTSGRGQDSALRNSAPAHSVRKL